jgi:hypothetical protein
MRPIAEALERLSADARAQLATPVQSFDPRDMQLSPGIEPKWYVVQTWSRAAEKELVKRRFGICVPEAAETIITRGRPSDRLVPLIAGYVFVFLWDTDANYGRLLRTNGVMAVLGWIEESEIDKLRYQENCERCSPGDREVLKQELLAKVQPRKAKKRRKSRRAK